MLKCYECTKEDIETYDRGEKGKGNVGNISNDEVGNVKKEKSIEAIALCIMCGKGLCMQHAHRIDLPIWNGGYPVPVKILNKGLPRFVCSECGNILLPGACE